MRPLLVLAAIFMTVKIMNINTIRLFPIVMQASPSAFYCMNSHGLIPCVSNPNYEPGILQLLIPWADDDTSRCVGFFGLFVTWWVSFLSFRKEQTAHFNCFIPFRICAPRVCEGQCRRQPARILQSAVSSWGEFFWAQCWSHQKGSRVLCISLAHNALDPNEHLTP